MAGINYIFWLPLPNHQIDFKSRTNGLKIKVQLTDATYTTIEAIATGSTAQCSACGIVETIALFSGTRRSAALGETRGRVRIYGDSIFLDL